MSVIKDSSHISWKKKKNVNEIIIQIPKLIMSLESLINQDKKVGEYQDVEKKWFQVDIIPFSVHLGSPN
jgi:hypothetical protein